MLEHCFAEVLFEEIPDTLEKSMAKTFIDITGTPFVIGGMLDRSTLFFEFPGYGYQFLRCSRIAVQYYIFHNGTQLLRNIFVLHACLRIDNAHVHAGLYGVIKEHRMQRLAYIVVATEGE